MDDKSIDWSAHDGFSEETCYCQCGTVFRSHGKFVANLHDGKPGLVSRKPCPECKKTDKITRVSSDPEYMSLR